jgi:hypothetical protein
VYTQPKVNTYAPRSIKDMKTDRAGSGAPFLVGFGCLAVVAMEEGDKRDSSPQVAICVGGRVQNKRRDL